MISRGSVDLQGSGLTGYTKQLRQSNQFVPPRPRRGQLYPSLVAPFESELFFLGELGKVGRPDLLGLVPAVVDPR